MLCASVTRGFNTSRLGNADLRIEIERYKFREVGFLSETWFAFVNRYVCLGDECGRGSPLTNIVSSWFTAPFMTKKALT